MKNLVIFRLGSLGDTIVALPCFNAIAARYPDHRRLVLTNVPVAGNAAPLLSVLGENGEIVHGAISYPVGMRSLKDILGLARELRSLGADEVIYLMPQRTGPAAWRDWLFLKLVGFGKIIGFPSTRDLRETRIDPQTGVVEPEAERLVRCVAELGPVNLTDPSVLDLHLNAAERKVGEDLVAYFAGKPFIALNMGGKAAEKDWGLENWKTLFTNLSKDFGQFGLLAVGAPVDTERAEALFKLWPGACVNGCGKLSPRESAAAMAHASAFIGHDSGPLHLAAAVDVPVLGLFGDYNMPNKWHPLGRRVSVIHNMQGMGAITVADVETAMRGILSDTETFHAKRQSNA